MSSPQPVPPTGPDVGSPPPSGEGTVGSAWRGIQDMNRWVLFGIVLAIALVIWYFYWYRDNTSSAPERDDPSQQWEDRARQLLTQRGYPQSQIDSALDHYLRGGQMSTQDVALISVVVRAYGMPSYPNPQPNTQDANPSPATPNGPVDNGNTPIGDDGETAYWYVPSTGFGYTSSFRGISQWAYGTEMYAPQLLQLNPGNADTIYGRIPPGKITKVPRSINA